MFKTKDLGEAAALYSLASADFIDLSQSDKDFYFFQFKNTRRIRSLSKKFWQSKLYVNAKNYSDNIKFLKIKIHDKQNRESYGNR